MNRINLKSKAKQQISNNIGAFLLMYVAIAVMTGIAAAVPAVGPLLGFVGGTLFEFSMIMIFLALARGVQPEFMNIFDIFKNTQLCGNALLLTILISIYTFLWSLLFIVPGIIKALSYSIEPYILAENDFYMSPSDAIKESMRIMEGHKMDLFVLMLSFFGWFLLCLITCGIALIYVSPYYEATLVNFYNEIKDKPTPTNPSYETVILN